MSSKQKTEKKKKSNRNGIEANLSDQPMFRAKRGRIVFKCTDQATKQSWQHDSHYDLTKWFEDSSSFKLFFVDSQLSRNSLTIGIKKRQVFLFFFLLYMYTHNTRAQHTKQVITVQKCKDSVCNAACWLKKKKRWRWMHPLSRTWLRSPLSNMNSANHHALR